MAEILDDLLGLRMTLGAVDVLEGRQCDPGDALGWLHHPLKSHVVAALEREALQPFLILSFTATPLNHQSWSWSLGHK